MSLGEVTARCEALQEALIRADMKCSQVGTRNEELEDELKKVGVVVVQLVVVVEVVEVVLLSTRTFGNEQSQPFGFLCLHVYKTYDSL